MADIPSIFLSHTASDADVAHAIRSALEHLFGEAVTVSYSTRKDLEGSIQSGEDWFGWITEQVRHAHVTLVVLTPASVQKPWILWETGAVFGAAAAVDTTDVRRVRPLTFGIKVADIPGPLASMRLQNAEGDVEEDIRQLLKDLVFGLRDKLPPERYFEIGQRVGGAVELWLTRTAEAMRLAPLLPTEPVVQEWMSRFKELADSDRVSEVGHLHQWMTVAFGRNEEEEERPLDVRLHRLLGDLYAASKQHDRAGAQYLLAHKLAPRDIYTLRFLGKAYLDMDEVDKAGGVIGDIDRLDPGATIHNPECAALKGRWLVATGKTAAARDVLAAAYESNKGSYYLADLLGQALLEDGEMLKAQSIYREALDTIERLEGANFWMHSTAATAAIVAGDEDAAKRHLQAVRSYKPTASELESIERGLLSLQQRLKLPDERFSIWRAWLREPEPVN